MIAQLILMIFLFLAVLWGIWKLLIFPRIPDAPIEKEHETFLREKLQKLENLRDEYLSVKKEKEATEEIEKLDREINQIIKEIKLIEQ